MNEDIKRLVEALTEMVRLHGMRDGLTASWSLLHAEKQPADVQQAMAALAAFTKETDHGEE